MKTINQEYTKSWSDQELPKKIAELAENIEHECLPGYYTCGPRDSSLPKGRYPAAYVKVHSYGDIEEAIRTVLDKRPKFNRSSRLSRDLRESAQRDLRNEFTDEEVWRIWSDWLEECRDSYLEYFLKGETLSSEVDYKHMRSAIEQGIKTNYTILDEIADYDEKMKKVAEWESDNKALRERLECIEGAALAGRQGGHLCFLPTLDMEEHIGELMDELSEDPMDKIAASDPGQSCYPTEEDCRERYELIKRVYDSLDWLIRDAEKTARDLDFQQALIERIEFHLDEQE